MSAKSVRKVSGQKTSVANQFSKNDPRYWEQVVYLPGKTRKNGEQYEGKIYLVKIQHRKKRKEFSTGESARRAAGKRALEIYHSLKAVGWPETLRRFGNQTEISASITVGEYLTLVEERAGMVPKTFATYAKKFRSIVGEIIEASTEPSKYDGTKGVAKWRKKIEAVEMATLTPEIIQDWKIKKLARAGHDPVALTKTRHTINSQIRNSKSLFGRRVLKLMKDITLPSPLPFAEVDYEKQGSMRYRSEIKPDRLLLEAQAELYEASFESEIAYIRGKPVIDNSPYSLRIRKEKAFSKKEAFKIFLLALCAGLRKKEIDLLQWEQILWDDYLIRIAATDCFSPKADSSGDVHVDPEVIGLLHEFRKNSESRFVIDGLEPRPDATYEYYRANRHHNTLIKWLRSKGVKAGNPIHSLRKEFGSILCRDAGILVASRLLRHSSIAITEKHYIDNDQRVTTGLGTLLRN